MEDDLIYPPENNDLRERIEAARAAFVAQHDKAPTHFEIAKTDRFMWTDMLASLQASVFIPWKNIDQGDLHSFEKQAVRFEGMRFHGSNGDAVRVWCQGEDQ